MGFEASIGSKQHSKFISCHHSYKKDMTTTVCNIMYNITPANLPAVITVHACTVIYIVLTESTCIALSTLTAVTSYTIYTCSIILTL